MDLLNPRDLGASVLNKQLIFRSLMPKVFQSSWSFVGTVTPGGLSIDWTLIKVDEQQMLREETSCEVSRSSLLHTLVF